MNKRREWVANRRTLQTTSKENRTDAIDAKDIKKEKYGRLQKMGRRRDINNKESGTKREKKKVGNVERE